MIKATNLEKTYGFKKVLKNISLSVDEGTSFALLGPNGAGKSTFVKSLLNLVNISGGDLRLDGHPVKSPRARQRVAYLPEGFNFFSYYTVFGIVAFYGKMRGLSGKNLENSVLEVLERVKMVADARLKVGALSKGMLQRTGIACTLIGESRLLIFDEPFSGLDPIGIKELKDTLRLLRKEGKTVFINSHILSEMQQICDRAAILHRGELLDSGLISEMTREHSLEDYFYQKINEAGE